MSRPTLEVADVLRASGSSFIERHGSHLALQYRKVMDAIVRCRPAALGGHRDLCLGCGHQAISYNLCRNRHGLLRGTDSEGEVAAALLGSV